MNGMETMQDGQPEDSSTPLFTGIGVALVTLFDDKGALLARQTADLAAQLVRRGMSAVLVAGSTGEPWSLSAAERTALGQEVRERVPAEVPVLLGTGAFGGWDETLEMTAGCAESGADAYLIMPPPGIPADPDHFARLRSIAGDTPVWAYHVPAVSAPGVPTDVAAQLDVAAMKDSSGDADRLAAEAIAFSRPLYVGSPTVLTLARALGLPGAILALGNTVPELCLAAFGGDLKAQAEVARLHIQSLAGFPAGLKQTIRDTYRTSAATRPRPR
jgi:4-hydroxy-tetrahydrodipicolinate synthase